MIIREEKIHILDVVFLKLSEVSLKAMVFAYMATSIWREKLVNKSLTIHKIHDTGQIVIRKYGCFSYRIISDRSITL